MWLFLLDNNLLERLSTAAVGFAVYVGQGLSASVLTHPTLELIQDSVWFTTKIFLCYPYRLYPPPSISY